VRIPLRALLVIVIEPLYVPAQHLELPLVERDALVAIRLRGFNPLSAHQFRT
jgi:hypothetical protein